MPNKFALLLSMFGVVHMFYHQTLTEVHISAGMSKIEALEHEVHGRGR